MGLSIARGDACGLTSVQYPRVLITGYFQDSLVISRQALEAYLGEDAIMSVLRHLATEEDQGQGCQKVLHLDDIVCEHGMLDPLKARDMKVVKYVSSPVAQPFLLLKSQWWVGCDRAFEKSNRMYH